MFVIKREYLHSFYNRRKQCNHYQLSQKSQTKLRVKERFFYIFVLGLTTHIDDEYKWAGVEDPKIMVTTSRDPSSKLKQFAKVIQINIKTDQEYIKIN